MCDLLYAILYLFLSMAYSAFNELFVTSPSTKRFIHDIDEDVLMQGATNRRKTSAVTN